MLKINKNSFVATLALSLLVGLSAPSLVLAAGPAAINLLSSGDFVILAKTGISTTGSTSVLGDIAVSPAAATFITGFALNLTAGSAFSTSPLVTGKVYAPDYATPTPVKVTTAISDMETAYTDGAGRTNPTATELGAGNIGGLTIAPGLYKWGTGVTIPTDVTLSGGANDVWIFQVAQTLTVSSGAKIILTGGAQAGNVFWVVGGQTTIGTGATFNGNIVDQTAIVLNTGATLTGRALAQTAVTLDANAVVMPATSAPAPAPTATPTPTPTATPTPAPTPSSSGTPSTSTTSGGSGSSQAQTPALTTAQQQQYNQFISAGASPSAALNAVNQMYALSVAPISIPAPMPVLVPEIRSLTLNLGKGSRGIDVAVLQQFLIAQNKGGSAQALAQAGATAYFGALTKSALAEFQAHVGIYPPLGNFGPITRAYLSTH